MDTNLSNYHTKVTLTRESSKTAWATNFPIIYLFKSYTISNTVYHNIHVCVDSIDIH